MLAIQKCLAADQSYITLAKSFVSAAPPGKILTLFAAMIVHHIKDHKKWVHAALLFIYLFIYFFFYTLYTSNFPLLMLWEESLLVAALIYCLFSS